MYHIPINNFQMVSYARKKGFPVALFLSFVLLLGCKEEPTIVSVNFEEAEFAHFVEPDFPYITTSLDGRSLGEGFPEDNISARVLAVKLGDDAAMAFDTD